MTEQEIQHAFYNKRNYFDSGATKSYTFRIEQLKKLRATVKKHEAEILQALYTDLHKPAFEAYGAEIGLVYAEINHALKNLKLWMDEELMPTPIPLHPSSSKVYNQPLGVVLIIAPWNYPFQLLLSPLVGAIAAGNCVMLKPSENTINVATIIEKMMTELFEEKYISVIQGDGEIVGPMLMKNCHFNHVFFTGSPAVGKKIMAMAAEHLTPVTLELGGKSPAIVDEHVNLNVAARRLVWGKYFNAGQTCIAPDYILVHESQKNALVEKIKKYIFEFYGENVLNNKDYAHIVNEKRFNTLISYLDNVSIIHGGKYDKSTLCIEPTIVENIPENHALLSEEIFGPILPIFTYRNIEEVIPFIRKNRYPLACYVFSKRKKTKQLIIGTIEFGGGCINNTLIHFANTDLPLGGFGNSGIGRYHGKYSFDVFSHKKSIMSTSTLIDPSLRYAPYTSFKNKILRLFLK